MFILATPNSRCPPSASATPRLLRLSRSNLQCSSRKLFHSQDFDATDDSVGPNIRTPSRLLTGDAPQRFRNDSENASSEAVSRQAKADGFPMPEVPSGVVKLQYSMRQQLSSPGDLTNTSMTSFVMHSEGRQVSQTPKKLQEFLNMYPATPTGGGRQVGDSNVPVSSLCESKMQYLSQTRSQLTMQRRNQSPHVSLSALGERSGSPSNQLPFNSSFVAYEESRSSTVPHAQSARNDENNEFRTSPNVGGDNLPRSSPKNSVRREALENPRTTTLSVDKKRSVSIRTFELCDVFL